MHRLKINKNILKSEKMMVLLALFVCLLWGSAYPSIVVSYNILNVNTNDVFQVMVFAGTRFMISSILIFIYAKFTNKSMYVPAKGLAMIAVLGLIQTFGQYAFFFSGLRTVHPANASIVSSLGVFMTVVIAHFFYRTDRLTTKKIIGMSFGILGIIILNGGTAGGFTLVGEGALLMAALLGAIAGVYTKKLTTYSSPYAISAYQLLIGSTLLLTLGLTLSQNLSFTFTLGSTTLLLYLGFLSAAAFTLWSALLKYHPVSKVSIYKFSIPVFGVILSFIFLANEFDIIPVTIALILVVTGIILINLPQKGTQK